MMTIDKALRLARKWAAGHVCTLREGEAQEYHQLCAEVLERSRWIPVEERLTEPNTDVLASRESGMNVEQYHRRKDSGYWTWDGIGKGFVTHWLPLPNDPKKEEDDG